MKKYLIKILILLIFTFISRSSVFADKKQLDFTSSNLPIIIINTNGQDIPYSNPRIIADMGVIYNGPGKRNNITDSLNNYSGRINIEIRGQSSAGWIKKSYGIETQNEDGSNNNVPLLGLPEENDWVLYASYYDRSFLRNVLTFKLANEMGWYASRTRYCELILNGEYHGIYILMEKIKRDKNRVDIAKLRPVEISGDDVTGGYIIKIDKEPWKPGFDSEYPPFPGADNPIRYQYHYPDPDDIVPEQEAYIKNFMSNFEYTMNGDNYNSPVYGYPKYLNVESFVDMFIINELSKNIDGYRLSSYFYKEKNSDGGKLSAGPIWDYNFSFGNIGFASGQYTSGWELFHFFENKYPVPFWWKKLLYDSTFSQQIIDRWFDLREDILNTDSIYHYIDHVADTLNEAKDRNFEIWIGPGDPKMPGDGWFPPSDPIDDFETYSDEIEYLKSWSGDRILWIDSNIENLLTFTEPAEPKYYNFKLKQNTPNPFSTETVIPYELFLKSHVRINIYNTMGKKIATLVNSTQEKGEHFVTWRPDGLASGIYFYEIVARDFRDVKKMILQK